MKEDEDIFNLQAEEASNGCRGDDTSFEQQELLLLLWRLQFPEMPCD